MATTAYHELIRLNTPRDRAFLALQELALTEDVLAHEGIPARPETVRNHKLAALQLWAGLSLIQSEIFLAQWDV